jgi:hypothetical protein
MDWNSKIGGEHRGLNISRRRRALELIEAFVELSPISFSWIALKYLKFESKFKFTERSFLRLIFSRFFKFNPIGVSEKGYYLVFFCSEKDLDVLPFSIVSARLNTSGFDQIYVIAPERIRERIQSISVQVNESQNISFLSDEYLLEKYLAESSSRLAGATKMQMLKIVSLFEINSDFAMLIDADTIILRKRAWVDESRFIIQVGQEYLLRHQKFNDLYLKGLCNIGIGFVTHHQILPISQIKKELFPESELNELAIRMQIHFNSRNDWESIYPSEWQIMGQFVYGMKSPKPILVQFSNIGMSKSSFPILTENELELYKIEDEIKRIQSKAPKLGSLSLHSYK